MGRCTEEKERETRRGTNKERKKETWKEKVVWVNVCVCVCVCVCARARARWSALGEVSVSWVCVVLCMQCVLSEVGLRNKRPFWRSSGYRATTQTAPESVRETA